MTTRTLPVSSQAVEDGWLIDQFVSRIRAGGPDAVVAAITMADYCVGWSLHNTDHKVPVVRQRLLDTGAMTPGGAIR